MSEEPEPTLSILVTTHERCGTLAQCLEAIHASRDRSGVVELLVVDDGSRDDTPAFLAEQERAGRVSAFIRNPQTRGPAAARNRGLARARGQYTLIMGDDVLLFPDALSHFLAHLREHRPRTASVLGNIQPTPRDITAFEHWSCNGGSQFGHWRISPEQRFDAGEEYFYTCNIVCSTDLLRRHPFDESFPYARYEDRELSYRLKRSVGHRIHYLPEARSIHEHKLPFRSWLRGFEKFTWAAIHFSRLHADDADLPRILGIERARGSTEFDWQALADCAELLNRYHRRYFDDGRGPERDWIRGIVGFSFRNIQEFFRTSYLRRHLGLPPAVDPAGGPDAESAMSRLLDAIDASV